MTTKLISVKEYAEKINPLLFRNNRKHPSDPITQQTIKYRIKHKLPLPKVLSYKKIGTIHVIEVYSNF